MVEHEHRIIKEYLAASLDLQPPARQSLKQSVYFDKRKGKSGKSLDQEHRLLPSVLHKNRRYQMQRNSAEEKSEKNSKALLN